MCEVLERFADEFAELQLQQYFMDRNRRPELLGLGRFHGNPKNAEELNATLPPLLRRADGAPEPHAQLYAYFVDVTKSLKRNIVERMKMIDPNAFVDVAAAEVPRNPALQHHQQQQHPVGHHVHRRRSSTNDTKPGEEVSVF